MRLTLANNQEVKRAACDLCRGQKVRCILNEGSGKCNRCRAAKAECIYSAPKRAGRPPSRRHPVTSRGGASHRRTSTGSTGSQQDPDCGLTSDWPPSARVSSTSMNRKRSRHQQQQQQDHNHNDQISHLLPRIGASDVSNLAPSVVNVASIPSSKDGFGTASGSVESRSEETLTLSAFSALSDSDFAAFMPWSDSPFTCEAPVPPFTAPQGYTTESANVDSHHSLWPDTISQTTDLGPFHQVLQHHQSDSAAPYDGSDAVDGESVDTSDTEYVSGLMNTFQDHNSSSVASSKQTRHMSPSTAPTHPKPSKEHVSYQFMQQLSELSVKLCTQVSLQSGKNAVDISLSSKPAATTAQRLEELTAQVLKNSTAFLDILASLQQTHTRIGVSAATATASHFDDTATAACMTPTSLHSSQHNLSGFHHAPPRHSPHLHSTASNGTAPRSPSSPSVVPDTAATLQLLIAYIHLTKLHHILYTTIHSYLFYPDPLSAPAKPSFKTLPIPALFPSLAIGGMSLATYPNFQIKLLLQVCVHHLGEIEAGLGLPAAFRVSETGGRADAGRTQGGGVLGSSGGGTALLVRTVMEDAGDRVQGIREVLSWLREGLRGSIDV